jgi:hypothetical protein
MGAATASIAVSAASTSGGSGSQVPPLRSMNMTSEVRGVGEVDPGGFDEHGSFDAGDLLREPEVLGAG